MTPTTDPRPVRILARTLVRDLFARGFDSSDVLGLATELIGRVVEIRQAAREASPPRRQRG